VMARILKQRVERLRNVDDRVIARRFNTNKSVMERLKAGVPTPPR